MIRGTPPRERGVAFLLVLFSLAFGVGVVMFTSSLAQAVALREARATSELLAAAKAALIGYAVSRGDTTGAARPGELPCPDTNNDGFAEAACVAGALGRIPWKTLGIAEPKDSAGEILWYSVADRFRMTSLLPINSDTRGSLAVYSANGAAPITTEAIAVIFAPGAALGSQRRDASITVCSTTATALAQTLCAANYLESAAARNNASTNGPYVSGAMENGFNDRVLAVTTQDLIPLVEQRVAVEAEKMIMDYFAANGYFPFAAIYNDATHTCAMGVRQGRLPLVIVGVPTLPALPCAALANWTGMPAWFAANQWHRVMHYQVGAGYVFAAGAGCTGGCLTVDTDTQVPALFFMPGTPVGATARPSNNLGDYLEDAQNRDGWAAASNDVFVSPMSQAFDRDRVYKLVLAGAGSCPSLAAKLLQSVVCGGPGNSVTAQCLAAANLLQLGCTCATAATSMIQPPCTNTTNPPQCQAAITRLAQCVPGPDLGLPI